MSQLGITAIKIVFFVALYLFVLRALRVMYLDIAGPRARKRKQPPPAIRVQSRSPGARAGAIAVSENGTASKSYKLDPSKPVTLGRSSECTIVVHDTYASQLHTRFFFKDGAWFVEDLGSTNGTLLNRVKLSDPSPVSPGDEVRLGKTVIEVRNK
ncbi:MAG: FHA domain-containing protein FhaB/FipA [Actinomycetota bacterium]